MSLSNYLKRDIGLNLAKRKTLIWGQHCQLYFKPKSFLTNEVLVCFKLQNASENHSIKQLGSLQEKTVTVVFR